MFRVKKKIKEYLGLLFGVSSKMLMDGIWKNKINFI